MKPITQEKDRLGFVGIGYMGRPIARRLLESGFTVLAIFFGAACGAIVIRYSISAALALATAISGACSAALFRSLRTSDSL